MLKNFHSIDAMDAYINSQIVGSFLTWDIQVLGEYVKRLKSLDQYLEIGTDHGKSAASAIFQANEGVKFYFIDINDPKASMDFLSRKSFFEQEGFDKISEFILGDSKEIAKKWKNGKLSMIFIDGDHLYEAVKADILAWIPHLKSGGYILFHDYDIPSFGVGKAVDELIRDSNQFEDFFYAQEKYQLKSSIAGARKK